MYQRILVPVDGSPTSARGLDQAIALARRSGARLRLVHVVDELLFANGFETPSIYLNDLVPRTRARAEWILDDGRCRAEAEGVVAETSMVDRGGARLPEVVDEQVTDWCADLVVLGTHGRRGAGRVPLGRDAAQIARTAKVPVLLVRSAALATR